MRVNFTANFWSVIVSSFDEVRGPLGEPALKDFKEFDFPLINDLIVNKWGELHEIDGFRMAYVPGKLKSMYIVFCVEEFPGIVAAVHVEIDDSIKFSSFDNNL